MAISKSENQRAPRHRWPLTEKRRIVELTLAEGASTCAIAREHSVHPTSLSHWKTLYRVGKLEAQPSRVRSRAKDVSNGTLLPVTVTPSVYAARLTSDCGRSIVQIVLSSGATLRIETDKVDVGILCALIGQLNQ